MRFPTSSPSAKLNRSQHALLLGCALLLLPHCMSLAAAEEINPTLPNPDLQRWHLLEPLWASPIVYGESVLFLKEGDAAPNARLALKPKRIQRVALADGSQVFDDSDYTVDPATRTITLTPKSRIPYLKDADLFPPKGSPRSHKSKAGDPSRDVLFEEGHWFHDQQVEVTYEADEPWTGFRPSVAGELLPRTLRKLRQGEPLTIALTGDSISAGDNASGVTGAKPSMPAYPQLVADQLRASFPGKINLVNRAVGGWRFEQGLKDLPKLMESKPDLVIIAFGMNHVRSRAPEKFKKMAAEMIEQIHAANKNAEILLVAPMYGNPQWSNTPPEQFPLHRDALASFVGPGIALCDVTKLWEQLLERKRFLDLTGNGVNHPDDFGHRLYAEAILGMLMEMPPAKP